MIVAAALAAAALGLTGVATVVGLFRDRRRRRTVPRWPVPITGPPSHVRRVPL